MFKLFPPGVNYDRKPQVSGEIIYAFSHAEAGFLGNLRLFVKDGMNHVEWEGNKLKENLSIQSNFELFIRPLMKDLKKTIKRLHQRKKSALPC